jgi:hypothetical protein
MMIQTENFRHVPIAVPDFEALGKLVEDCGKEQVREQEITQIGEAHSRVVGRWPRQMTLDGVYRAPSLFTWRC